MLLGEVLPDALWTITMQGMMFLLVKGPSRVIPASHAAACRGHYTSSTVSPSITSSRALASEPALM